MKEIGQSIKANIRWQSTAIFTLQNCAEDYMVWLFDASNLCAIHAQRQTTMHLEYLVIIENLRWT